jgi:hyperosmotically inducible periplasmic protein
MNRLETTVLLALLLAGCDDSTSTTRSSTSPPPAASPSAPPSTPAPDNTERNKVDRSGETKTPMDQSNQSADIAIVAEIRKAIMGDSAMSVDAQNCKIIVSNGAVTLRGPVKTAEEKSAIEAKARSVTGVTTVDNQLEVKP